MAEREKLCGWKCSSCYFNLVPVRDLRFRSWSNIYTTYSDKLAAVKQLSIRYGSGERKENIDLMRLITLLGSFKTWGRISWQ